MCMSGGYALSGRGPLWVRIPAGAVFMAGPVAWALTAESVGGADFALTTPHGAWIAVLFYTLLAELAIASSIPHRPVATVPAGVEAATAEPADVEAAAGAAAAAKASDGDGGRPRTGARGRPR